MFPFWGVYGRMIALIAGGSSVAYVSVIPVLAAMIAFGCRTPPRGVGDPESDWILAALFGGLGLFLRHLMSHRFPTLSGLWQLPLVGAVLWAACLAAVLFGVRRVMQTWPLWVFVFATATPLPYLLCTAAAGGGPVAAAACTGLVGAVAVFIAGRLSPLGWRLGAATVSAGLSVGVGIAAGIGRSSPSPLLLAVLTGGVVPVAVFVVLQSRAARPEKATSSTLPERSPLSLFALALGAVIVFMLNRPFATLEPTPVRAHADWAARLNLSEGQAFPFIQRYLGPRATYIRYPISARAGFPEAVVDVITTDNLAALRTYQDAIWYPVTAPPNYHALDPHDPTQPPARAAATDSSLATSGHAIDWYLVTWSWQVGDLHQQVLVVVNQTWTSHDPPPDPVPLSLRANIIGPALWLMRQQDEPSPSLDPVVTTRASQIAREVMSAGGFGDG